MTLDIVTAFAFGFLVGVCSVMALFWMIAQSGA